MSKKFRTDYLPNAQKYTPELVEKAKLYVKEWKDNGDAMPSAERFCLYLGVSRASLFSWANKYPEFAAIMEEMNLTQIVTVLNGSLKNELNSHIAKLILSVHGYHEQTKIDNTSSDGSMSPKPGIDVSKLSTSALAEILNAANPANKS